MFMEIADDDDARFRQSTHGGMRERLLKACSPEVIAQRLIGVLKSMALSEAVSGIAVDGVAWSASRARCIIAYPLQCLKPSYVIVRALGGKDDLLG